jgi:hypothetical protein
MPTFSNSLFSLGNVFSTFFNANMNNNDHIEMNIIKNSIFIIKSYLPYSIDFKVIY